jgi:hypothetical protein
MTTSAHAALFDFWKATENLTALPSNGQIELLKYQLFVALERAADFQSRAVDAEQKLDQYDALFREQQELAAQQAAELGTAHAQHDHETLQLRSEVQSLLEQRTTLSELCASLFQIVERHTADDVDDEARTIPLPMPLDAAAV